MLPALTAAYLVIRYDARGFGRSPAPAVEFSLYDDLVKVNELAATRIPGCELIKSIPRG